jgi:2,4-dienoyl-CoA reductase-like NADH-dependent reductase (Old Yellow Enzyme family)
LPLTARLSVTDWQPGGVTIEDSIELAKQFKTDGLDMLDISQGFITPDISIIPWAPAFMVPHSGRIRSEADLPTAVGWMITEPEQAERAIASGQADVVMLARELLRDPYWPYHAALALNDDRVDSVLPVQYARAVKKR